MNIIKSYNKLSSDVKAIFKTTYANGFEGFIRTIKLGDKHFTVVPLTLGTDNYLVKLKQVPTDKKEFDPSKIQWDAESELE